LGVEGFHLERIGTRMRKGGADRKCPVLSRRCSCNASSPECRETQHGWVYLLLSTVGGVIAIVMRRIRSTWPSLLLYASALLYTLPLSVVSPSSATRFNSWLICGSVVATWLLVSALRVQPENDPDANQAPERV